MSPSSLLSSFTSSKPEQPFIVKLGYDELDGCCGVKVIYNLDSYPLAIVKLHTKEFVEWLKDATSDEENEEADYDDDEPSYVTPEGIALITINRGMKDIWEPILLEVGFLLKERATNKKTDNQIFIYTKVIHRD